MIYNLYTFVSILPAESQKWIMYMGQSFKCDKMSFVGSSHYHFRFSRNNLSLSLYSFRLLSPPTTSVKVYGPCICGNVACQCILAFTLRFRVGIHVIPLTQTTSAGREKGRALTLMAEACMCVCAWEDGLDFGVFAQTNFVSESLDSDDSKSLSLFLQSPNIV